MGDPLDDRARSAMQDSQAARTHASAAEERARSAAAEAWRCLDQLDRLARRLGELASARRVKAVASNA
jgi:hypothetical protein